MQSKSFWHRLVAVMTLTIFLVTIQFTLPYSDAWAETLNCSSDKMSHTECTQVNVTNVTINNSSTPVKHVDPPVTDNSNLIAAGIGAVGGAVGGAMATITAVSGTGSVIGLSAAGVTSGLAAIGSIVGGGMVAGLAVSAAVPVATAVGVGFVAKNAWDWINPFKESQKPNISSQETATSLYSSN